MRPLTGHPGDDVHIICACLTSPLYCGNLLVVVEEFSYLFIHVVGGYGTSASCRYPVLAYAAGGFDRRWRLRCWLSWWSAIRELDGSEQPVAAGNCALLPAS